MAQSVGEAGGRRERQRVGSRRQTARMLPVWSGIRDTKAPRDSRRRMGWLFSLRPAKVVGRSPSFPNPKVNIRSRPCPVFAGGPDLISSPRTWVPHISFLRCGRAQFQGRTDEYPVDRVPNPHLFDMLGTHSDVVARCGQSVKSGPHVKPALKRDLCAEDFAAAIVFHRIHSRVGSADDAMD